MNSIGILTGGIGKISGMDCYWKKFMILQNEHRRFHKYQANKAFERIE